MKSIHPILFHPSAFHDNEACEFVALTPAQVMPVSVLDALQALTLLRRDERAAREQSPVAILDTVEGQDTVRRLVAMHGAATVARWVAIFATEFGEAI